MLTHEELLEHPNYLLSTYQLEIFRQLSDYMSKNNLKKKDVAEKLKVSKPYVSQVLKGDFNFTLKKLIELGLMMNKIPYLEFVEPQEYWRREKEGTKRVVYLTVGEPKSYIGDIFSDYDFDVEGGRAIEESKVTVKIGQD